MSKRNELLGLALVAVSAGVSVSAQEPVPAALGSGPHQQFLQVNCIVCHNRSDQSAAALFAGLFFDEIDVTNVAAKPETWEHVVRKLRTGMMPPSGRPRPDAANKEAFLTYLEGELDALAAQHPNPGRPALHRVNRTEYANAIRDLLDLEIDPRTLLPGDDSSFGFDNIAGSLSVSPALLERYVVAAGKISRLAMGDLSMPDHQEKYVVPGDLTQTEHIEGLPLGTRGGMLITHYFPVDAEYTLRADLVQRGGRMFGSNTGRAEQLEVTLDGRRVGLYELSEYEVADGITVTLPVAAGPHEIGAAFLKKNHAPVEDINRPFEFSLFEPAIDPDPYWTFVPHLGSLTITGPFNTSGVGDTPPRRRIFVCRPQAGTAEDACAHEIIETLATRAFRKPPSVEQLSTLMDFYAEGRQGGSFDDGIELALRRILASPEFVFRFERQPAGSKPGDIYEIDDFELASRLSFFLWSSIPDDELLRLAGNGSLSRSAVLHGQVVRMLADPRSHALTENFAGQWLFLRNLDVKGGAVEFFPDFDDNLRQAFRTETEMFFDSIMREDHSVVDLLTADYTFVNERLARHYGIPGIYGSNFRRVQHTNEARYGLLGQGSMLTLTSNPERTSPVQRGVWVLENIIGAPVPTPPPNVPDLAEAAAHESRPKTLRAQMELHRDEPFCSGCHKIMDPVGFALENFDATGHWRDVENGEPINATSTLVDGTQIDGVVGLRQALMKYSDRFVETMTEKLLTYALGRGLEYYDMPVVRAIVRDSARSDYRFSELVMGIVTSEPFRLRIVEEAPDSTQIVAER